MILDDEAPTLRGNAFAHRLRWIWAVSAACVVIAAGAFTFGLYVRSPWDTAAANAALHPNVTVAVTRRALIADSDKVTGTLSLGQDRAVAVNADWTDLGVVTATYTTVGAAVKSGDPLLQVSGRPIVALSLPFPLYRRLAPSESGPDVAAVQRSLSALGVYGGPIDGVYGAETAHAVQALYLRSGLVPPAPNADVAAAAATQASAAAAAHEVRLGAERDVLRASEAARVARNGDHPEAVTDTQADLDRANAALDAAITASKEADAANSTAQFDALTPLPREEIVDIAGGGETVVALAGIGQVLGDGGAAVTLRSGRPSVVARVGAATIDRLRGGAMATVSSLDDDSISSVARVVSVSDFVAHVTESGQPPGYDVTLQLETATGFEDGAQVLVNPQEPPATYTGLAVPLTAIRSDGTATYVEVVRAGASTTERVDVAVTTSAGGYALVDGSGLREGDEIEVG